MHREYLSGRHGEEPTPSIAVIGAGFGGIAAAVKLRQAKLENFTVFERSSSPGGTWWDNHYPGAETDAPSHLYSYSFMGFDWSRTHVRQPELRTYLEAVVNRFDLGPRIRFGTGVASLAWDRERNGYVLTTTLGERLFFHAVISAVGMFSKPRWPTWPGLAGFQGVTLHTARWDDTQTFTGKRVAVVGTGSSAAQVVPALAPHVESLHLFQRQPGWLLPKRDRDFTRWEQRVYRSRAAQKLHRLKLYALQDLREWRGALFRPGTRVNDSARRAALAYIAEVFAHRPDLSGAVTPDYPFAGKRAVLSSDFFPALLRSNVTLVPRAVSACTPAGIIDTAGAEHAVDVIVLATGFEATEYLSSLRVLGRAGRSLAEVWDGEPYAFLGLVVPEFPNFFMLYGPNTNGGLIVSNLERQAEFAAQEIRRLARRRIDTVEVTETATRRYNDWLQRRIAVMAYASGENYYKTASGRVVTQWPDNATMYALLTKVLRPLGRWRAHDGVVRRTGARWSDLPTPRHTSGDRQQGVEL